MLKASLEVSALVEFFYSTPSGSQSTTDAGLGRRAFMPDERKRDSSPGEYAESRYVWQAGQ
jgi:hypothetical protein